MKSRTQAIGAFVRMASRPIPRVSRMIRVARDAERGAVFVGAFRDPDLPSDDIWEDVRVRRVGAYFPLLKGKDPLRYLVSTLRFGAGVVRELARQQPDFVHASDFESALPSVLYCAATGTPLIYNIHDNLAIRYVLPSRLPDLLNALEAIMTVASDVTLVPEPFRRDLLPSWCRHKIRVVRNTPVDPGFRDPPPPGDRPRVMYAGWLDRGRGLGQLVEMARRDQIELVVAGNGDMDLLDGLAAIPRAKYLGFLNHGQIMEATAHCDFVAAFYDPARPINKYAASNKIAESLALGRPVLVNDEMLVAGELAQAECAVIVPYTEIESIPAQLDALLDSRNEYLAMCRRARSYYEQAYDWNGVAKTTAEVYASIGITRRSSIASGGAHGLTAEVE